MVPTSIHQAVSTLRASPQPAIRWRVETEILGKDPGSPDMQQLRESIRQCDLVKQLLSHRDADGRILSKQNVYDKWQGAHWILAALADIGYPPGDADLNPVKEQVLDFWLSDYYFREFEAKTKTQAYKKEGVPVIQGRHRRCASQQGNALYALLKLELTDPRLPQLVERLLHWQWPDGGWNCDKNPEARHASFMESLLPLRGLALYTHVFGDKNARQATVRAAEVFLERRLYKSRRTGQIIHPEFVLLHYPLYWHYDFLAGLKVMTEAGFIHDPRCNDALDLLENKMLPGGGWPAESRYYTVSDEPAHGADYVDWGGTSKHHPNEWVTLDALIVLKRAGRI